MIFSSQCFDGIDNGDVNLSDLRVTLDLICLTLPPETDLAESTNRPCYTRMTSHVSQMSYRSSSSLSDFDDVMDGVVGGADKE